MKQGNIYYTDKDFTDLEVSTTFKYPCMLILKNAVNEIEKITTYNENGIKSIYDFSLSASKQFVTDSIAPIQSSISSLQNNKLDKPNLSINTIPFWHVSGQFFNSNMSYINGNIGINLPGAATENLEVGGNIKATQFKDANGDLKSQRTITITGNITLSETHNGAVLNVTNTCNITIPTGLDANFQCVIFAKGSVIVTFVNGGVTVYAPSGLLLKTDKMAALVSTSANNFNLTGELATT